MFTNELKRSPKGSVGIICFHENGGSPSTFLHLKNVLMDRKNCDLFSFSLRKKNYTKYDEVKSEIENFVKSTDLPDKNVVIGHSMGSITAFEFSKCLDEISPGKMKVLFSSACRAPHIRYKVLTKSSYATDWYKPETIRLLETVPPAINVSDEILIEILTSMGIDLAIMSKEQVKNLISGVRKDTALFESYVPTVPKKYSFSVRLSCGHNDINVDIDDMLQWAMYTNDFKGPKFFSGNHTYIHKNTESFYKYFFSEIELLGFDI